MSSGRDSSLLLDKLRDTCVEMHGFNSHSNINTLPAVFQLMAHWRDTISNAHSYSKRKTKNNAISFWLLLTWFLVLLLPSPQVKLSEPVGTSSLRVSHRRKVAGTMCSANGVALGVAACCTETVTALR